MEPIAPAASFTGFVAERLHADSRALASEWWARRARLADGPRGDAEASVAAAAAMEAVLRDVAAGLGVPLPGSPLTDETVARLREAGGSRFRGGGTAASIATDASVLAGILSEALEGWLAVCPVAPRRGERLRVATLLARSSQLPLEPALLGWEEVCQEQLRSAEHAGERARLELSLAMIGPVLGAERASRLLERMSVLRTGADATRISRRIRKHLARALAALTAEEETGASRPDAMVVPKRGTVGGARRSKGVAAPEETAADRRGSPQRNEPGGQVVLYGKEDDGTTLRVFLRRGQKHVD